MEGLSPHSEDNNRVKEVTPCGNTLPSASVQLIYSTVISAPKVVILKISVLVDLATPCVVWHCSKHNLNSQQSNWCDDLQCRTVNWLIKKSVKTNRPLFTLDSSNSWASLVTFVNFLLFCSLHLNILCARLIDVKKKTKMDTHTHIHTHNLTCQLIYTNR